MYQGIFQSTTIPVLQQVVGFTEARHNVLAGNIANLDTPGYRERDLSVEDFQTRLREAIEHKNGSSRVRSPGDPPLSHSSRMADVAKDSHSILYHDGSNVGLEFQVSEMVKNQLQHNMALTIMSSQMQLLQVAISERV